MIDAHAHLSSTSLNPLVFELILALKSQGIRHVILGGVDVEDWHRQLEISLREPNFVTSAFGIHPWTVDAVDEKHLEIMYLELMPLANHCTLLGEIGVDFHRSKSQEQREKQVQWFKRQMQLAHELKKPTVLHIVKAHDVAFKILKQVPFTTGMIHGFQGTSDLGQRYIDLGFLLSVGTRFLKSAKPSTTKWLKPENIVLESDGPQKHWRLEQPVEIAKVWKNDLMTGYQLLSDQWGMDFESLSVQFQNNIDRVLALKI